MKPCAQLHPTPDPECPICWRAEHSRVHQRMWGLPETGQSADAREAPRFTTEERRAPTPLPCVHLGAAVRGENAPDTLRDWRRCKHPETPLGAAVCTCKGCGPNCPGYQAEG